MSEPHRIKGIEATRIGLMLTEPLFCSLSSAAMADNIRRAQIAVCYAAPGIRQEPADAMVEVAKQIGPELITVCLDFDERVMRMGFGELAAVQTLRNAGIVVNSSPGLRTRSPTHKPHPNFDGGEFDEREVIGVVFFETRRDGLEVFELVEKAFHEIAQPIEDRAEHRNIYASRHRLDVAPGALCGKRFA